MINIISIILIVTSLSCFEAVAIEPTNYSAKYENDSYHIQKNGKKIFSFETSPAKYSFEVVSDNQLLAMFAYEIGNVTLLLLDDSTSKVVDTLKLDHFESLSTNGTVKIFGGENKFTFLEPGSPFWPNIFTINENAFFEVDIKKHPNYIVKMSKDTIEYMEHILDVCENHVQNCFYNKEYLKAARQLRELSKLLVL
jgi:hypothetical protein